jgi:hypothetical protein
VCAKRSSGSRLSPKIQHKSARIMTDSSQITDDTRLRLARAPAIASPDGSMSASGLLVEADRGRLVTYRIAGKEYSTLANIRRMIDRCPRDPKVRGCGSAVRGGVAMGESRSPAHGSSATMVDTRKALAAALTIAQGLSRPSPTKSSVSRSLRRERKDVMPLRSRSRDGATAMRAWSLVPWELAGDVDAQS